MSFGGDSANSFVMHGEKGPEDITRIDAKKDLGIWLSPNLSFSMHLEKSAQKAFAVLRMIRRTFSRITRADFQILHGAYVRPLLEYDNPVVYSGRTKDVTLTDRVQRAATKLVAGLKSMDYETRLVVLDLFPLEYRHLRGGPILTDALFEQGLDNGFFTVDPANTRWDMAFLFDLGVYEALSKVQVDLKSAIRGSKTRARLRRGGSEREFTSRKVRGSNPTSVSQLPLSILGQPGSIPALVLPLGDLTGRISILSPLSASSLLTCHSTLAEPNVEHLALSADPPKSRPGTPTITVLDVYDIAASIGKEFEAIIDRHGPDSVSSLMPKVISVLEELEDFASRFDSEGRELVTLQLAVRRLELEKCERANDRTRSEKEFEQLEETWQKETRELLQLIDRLKEENAQLREAVREQRESKDAPSDFRQRTKARKCWFVTTAADTLRGFQDSSYAGAAKCSRDSSWPRQVDPPHKPNPADRCADPALRTE
ncbi:RILP-like protein homolog [Clonorchis sinensis]|uniref:RILP-like protein homolog n=1 Tax=Clonorchis sinensis TaxID=79923 RepID=G7YMA0_CLOSI|nr:RILP-like protein homolog [Clonorchis sinensis]